MFLYAWIMYSNMVMVSGWDESPILRTPAQNVQDIFPADVAD